MGKWEYINIQMGTGIVGELKETAKYLDDYGYDTEFILHNLMTD